MDDTELGFVIKDGAEFSGLDTELWAAANCDHSGTIIRPGRNRNGGLYSSAGTAAANGRSYNMVEFRTEEGWVPHAENYVKSLPLLRATLTWDLVDRQGNIIQANVTNMVDTKDTPE